MFCDEQKKEKLKLKSCFNRFITVTAHHLMLRKTLKAWRKYVVKQKKKDRIRFYNRNILFRRKLKLIFNGWKAYTHECFKERMAQDTGDFRAQLEGRMLIQWKGRVDAQMLYMAQLEEKIKMEIEAREALEITYARSLNQGLSKLDRETQELAENPRVREISLAVAR